MTARANAAKRLKVERERDNRALRRTTLAVGIIAILMGLFIFADSFLTHTLPYEELTEATIEVKQVSYLKYKGEHTCSVEDTNGARYVVEGMAAQETDLTEVLQPGDVVTVKYQPAYYRYRHAIQELRLNGQRLVTYRSADPFLPVFQPIAGGVVAIAGIVVCVTYDRNKKKK